MDFIWKQTHKIRCFDFSEDLAKFKFTTCFIKECLRWYSPVPAFNRRLSEPLSIGGATFPPETVVDILPSCLHHNPAVWDHHNVSTVLALKLISFA